MNNLKTLLLMTALTALVAVIGHSLGGATGLVLASLFAAAMNFGAYWYSDRMVLAMHRARAVSAADEPALVAMVESLARRAGLPTPRVYLVDDPSPNAFATGRNPEHAAVAFTTGLLAALDADEIEAVAAHELGHVLHRDTLIGTVAATAVGVITGVANMAMWGLMLAGGSRDDRDGGGFGQLLMLLLAPFAATLLQMAISRSREYEADRLAAALTGRPEALAGALARIHAAGARVRPRHADPATAHMYIMNPLRGGGIATLFSTHPPVEARIARLRELAVEAGRSPSSREFGTPPRAWM